MIQPVALAVFALICLAPPATNVLAESPPALLRNLEALVEAYPDFLERIEGNVLVWKDNTRMTIDDGLGPKEFEQRLDKPDIKDMYYVPYTAGRTETPPPFQSDPGRVRYQPLFDKMYGNCLAGEVESQLVEIEWLPVDGAVPQKLKVHKANGVAEKLAAVVRDLSKLPEDFRKFLQPSAGTFNCRAIAGTTRVSAHGQAIAIDINVDHSNYWRWTKPDADGRYAYKNRIPWEIVEIFERHGFIWGGKWYHYDTMHFEYRPDLLLPARAATVPMQNDGARAPTAAGR